SESITNGANQVTAKTAQGKYGHHGIPQYTSTSTHALGDLSRKRISTIAADEISIPVGHRKYKERKNESLLPSSNKTTTQSSNIQVKAKYDDDDEIDDVDNDDDVDDDEDPTDIDCERSVDIMLKIENNKNNTPALQKLEQELDQKEINAKTAIEESEIFETDDDQKKQQSQLTPDKHKYHRVKLITKEEIELSKKDDNVEDVGVCNECEQ
ncbi:unnamed protein product, partial [Adineta steineri]